jgi:hypothetical protein
MAYPPCFDIGEGRLTETFVKCAREVADAELRDAGKVRDADAEAKIRLDVRYHPFRLPGCQAPPRIGPISWTPRSLPADSQKLCRLLHAGFRLLAVAVEQGCRRGQELDQRCVAGTAG